MSQLSRDLPAMIACLSILRGCHLSLLAATLAFVLAGCSSNSGNSVTAPAMNASGSWVAADARTTPPSQAQVPSSAQTQAQAQLSAPAQGQARVGQRSRQTTAIAARPAQPASAAPAATSQPAAPAAPVVRQPAPPPLPAPTFVRGPGNQATYNSVATGERYLALTFDDGPHPTHTPRLLDILARHNAKATFYVVGTNVERYPEIMRRIVAEGHEVGNHTWNHPDLVRLERNQGRAAVADEISRASDAIVAVTGRRPTTFRPPYGSFSQAQRTWLRSEYGMPSILWNVDPRDWQRPGASVVTSRLVSGASPGGILLAHDIHGATIDAVPAVLEQLQAQGYRFVTVSQLISLEGRSAPASAQASAAGSDEGGDLSEGEVASATSAADADVAAEQDASTGAAANSGSAAASGLRPLSLAGDGR